MKVFYKNKVIVGYLFFIIIALIGVAIPILSPITVIYFLLIALFHIELIFSSLIFASYSIALLDLSEVGILLYFATFAFSVILSSIISVGEFYSGHHLKERMDVFYSKKLYLVLGIVTISIFIGLILLSNIQFILLMILNLIFNS